MLGHSVQWFIRLYSTGMHDISSATIPKKSNNLFKGSFPPARYSYNEYKILKMADYEIDEWNRIVLKDHYHVHPPQSYNYSSHHRLSKSYSKLSKSYSKLSKNDDTL